MTLPVVVLVLCVLVVWQEIRLLRIERLAKNITTTPVAALD